MEKAYDTTWKHGILLDLYKTVIGGRLPMFICDFLSDRYFKVRVGNTYGILTQRRQVSHRVVFFPSHYLVSRLIVLYLAFCLILNVDDLAIYYSSSHMPSIKRKLQHSLNRLGRWCDENGFKFSPTKTMCVHFCQL